jgi:hypothetical protein
MADRMPVGRQREPASLCAIIDHFSEDAAPMPLVFVITAGADKVEQDATETKLNEESLHLRVDGFFGFAFCRQNTLVRRAEGENLRWQIRVWNVEFKKRLSSAAASTESGVCQKSLVRYSDQHAFWNSPVSEARFDRFDARRRINRSKLQQLQS